MGSELSVIIPAYKECGNVSPLIEKLRLALKGMEWEVIYVDDDSPDGTSDKVREEAVKDPRVRLIQRIGRRGLSSACIEGMLSSSAPYLAVMDADLQHDEKILPLMLQRIKKDNLDIVIGSRYVDGGGMENWSKERVAASKNATRFAQFLTGVKVEDPMSGYFLVRQEFFHKTVRNLNGRGFKILLDIMMSSPDPVKFAEVPFIFRQRQHGESKLNFKVILDYFALVMDKAVRRMGRRK
ncbi:MAG: polyprenol monophosphomannose synthase [Candidatus Omnitrophica bacterium]|nr:polyprenol monophosphomannose synthase [Candidatus Omnitrophota bacterium]